MLFRLFAVFSLSAGIAAAQNLPAPAGAPDAPPAQPTPKPGVTVHSDNAADLLNQPPVRAGQNDAVVIVTPDSPPVAVKVSSVGGVSVRGLTDLAALQRLQAAFGPKLKENVTLDDGTQKWQARREQLGVTIPYRDLLSQARAAQKDIPLRFDVNLEIAQKELRALAPKLDGLELAIDGSAQRIKAALGGSNPQSSVALVTRRMPKPAQTTPQSGVPAFPFVLGEYSSRYDARLRGRTKNLLLAAKAVNGTVIPDGAIFSTNKTIGPRNAADGWKEAQMFVSGQVVSGVGAGICQCASNLYNAALLAGLPIVERHPHMFRVPYVPASLDATIYWGGKDMRFRNDTGGPMYVEAYLRGGRFHVRLLGTQPLKGKFAVESRVISRKNGTLSEAYRVARTENEVIKQKLSRDFYKPHP